MIELETWGVEFRKLRLSADLVLLCSVSVHCCLSMCTHTHQEDLQEVIPRLLGIGFEYKVVSSGQ